MDVNTICSGRGVVVRPVPAGESLPPEGVNQQEQIAIISEVQWLLEAAVKFWELYANQVYPVLVGGLNQHTQEIYGQIKNELAAQTGVAAQDIALDILLQKVIDKLVAENQSSNAGDIAKLKGLLPSIQETFNYIREGLASAGEHPYAAAAYSATHIENRIPRLELQAVVEQLVQKLPPETRTMLNFSEIRSWGNPPSDLFSNLDNVISWIGDLTRTISNVKLRAGAIVMNSCNTLASLIPEPPVITPPVVPPPPPPTEEGLKLNYELSLSPVYDYNPAGDAENQMGLSGFAGLRLDFNDEMNLQFNYQGRLNLAQDFSSAQTSEDSGSVAFTYDWAVIQAGYLWSNDFTDGSAQQLGNLGFGANLLDGKLYPFIGGLAGTTFGGYAGISGGYTFDDLMKLNLRAQAYYEYLNGHQAGGQLQVGFSPVSFLGNDLNLGVSAGGYYLVDPNLAALAFGLQLSYGNIINPQPLSVQQAAQGGF